jgi:hypothetical protein
MRHAIWKNWSFVNINICFERFSTVLYMLVFNCHEDNNAELVLSTICIHKSNTVSPHIRKEMEGTFKQCYWVKFPSLQYDGLTDPFADHSGRTFWGMKCLRSLEHWDRGFESHSRHGCLFAFILCLCQVAALRWVDPTSKESYRLSKKLKWNERFTDALCSKCEQQEQKNDPFWMHRLQYNKIFYKYHFLFYWKFVLQVLYNGFHH